MLVQCYQETQPAHPSLLPCPKACQNTQARYFAQKRVWALLYYLTRAAWHAAGSMCLEVVAFQNSFKSSSRSAPTGPNSSDHKDCNIMPHRSSTSQTALSTWEL